MKKVLIISTSIRNGSNSELLAKEFEKGAKEAGHDVEFVSLKDKNIAFCHFVEITCPREIIDLVYSYPFHDYPFSDSSSQISIKRKCRGSNGHIGL